jgi:hypothetical protein
MTFILRRGKNYPQKERRLISQAVPHGALGGSLQSRVVRMPKWSEG